MGMSKRPLSELGEKFQYAPCKTVAEIGCNHMGSMEIAKELMKLAKECGATYAKFQKRCPKELLTDEQYNKPHPNPANSYGDTYGAFTPRSLSHSNSIFTFFHCLHFIVYQRVVP